LNLGSSFSIQNKKKIVNLILTPAASIKKKSAPNASTAPNLLKSNKWSNKFQNKEITLKAIK
jgi:hypothetical protein